MRSKRNIIVVVIVQYPPPPPPPTQPHSVRYHKILTSEAQCSLLILLKPKPLLCLISTTRINSKHYCLHIIFVVSYFIYFFYVLFLSL